MRIVRWLLAATLAMAAGAGTMLAQQPTAEPSRGTTQIWVRAELARPARPNACLHGPDESGAEAARRVAATAYVRALNTLQGEFFERQTRYAHLSELVGLGGLPMGFVLQHAEAGNSYLFSLKDQRDPCGYTLYSDHSRVVYAAAPVESGPAP